MNKYILSKTIEDGIQAVSHYEAFLEFRKRASEGYYNIQPLDVEFVGEVPPEESTPESP
ncbi:hypothetical protein ES703_104871 [subsurface metagenome]